MQDKQLKYILVKDKIMKDKSLKTIFLRQTPKHERQTTIRHSNKRPTAVERQQLKAKILKEKLLM